MYETIVSSRGSSFFVSQGKTGEQVYRCQVNREQCPNTLPIDKHIDLVRKYIRAFLYRFAGMTSLNETSSRRMIFLVVPSFCVIEIIP
ncbi:hypothetical protein PG_0197 [Porphyromonas gingivalis W83]|uniref:Uncharacterized protein n=1 Tax=Porphyromonas gingivalis (strain ATCC BAA-308 / W83) TaxID=242619 RepID=Q7MXI8_PORGI|nr:hypothetical protein PG_0197 [Porphyromonas gingivalis W83]